MRVRKERKPNKIKTMKGGVAIFPVHIYTSKNINAISGEKKYGNKKIIVSQEDVQDIVNENIMIKGEDTAVIGNKLLSAIILGINQDEYAIEHIDGNYLNLTRDNLKIVDRKKYEADGVCRICGNPDVKYPKLQMCNRHAKQIYHYGKIINPQRKYRKEKICKKCGASSLHNVFKGKYCNDCCNTIKDENRKKRNRGYNRILSYKNYCKIVPIIRNGINIGKEKYVGSSILIDKEDVELLSGMLISIKENGCVTANGRSMSRIITDAPKNMYVDHINHNRLDNRRCNLRICTPIEGCWNKKTMKGITPNGDLWLAYIHYKGIRYTKTYTTKEEAINARIVYEVSLYGKFSPNYEEYKHMIGTETWINILDTAKKTDHSRYKEVKSMTRENPYYT